MLRSVKPRGSSRALLSVPPCEVGPSSALTSSQAKASFSTRRPRRTADKTEEPVAAVACPTIKLANDAVAQVAAHARTASPAVIGSTTSPATRSPPAPAVVDEYDERHRMPEPVPLLVDPAAELDLHAAFADGRALLELNAYDEEKASSKEAYRRLYKVPHFYFNRRSATREAEPYPLGYSSDHPSTTSRPPREATGQLARFLGMRKPPHQAQQLGPYNPLLPDAVQEHLANTVVLEPPSAAPSSTLAPLPADLRAIAPFGLAGQSTVLSDPWPSTSSTRDPARRLAQVAGILAGHTKQLLDPAHTAAIWRTALLSMRERGQLPPARLAALAAEAQRIINERETMQDDGVQLSDAMANGAVTLVVPVRINTKPSRQARRGRRGAPRIAPIGLGDNIPPELRSSLTTIVDVLSRALGSSQIDGSSDASHIEQTLRVRLAIPDLLSFCGRIAQKALQDDADRKVDQAMSPPPTANEAIPSVPRTAEEQALHLVLDFGAGRQKLLQRDADLVALITQTSLHPHTAMPSDRSLLVEYRLPARSLQRQLRTHYARCEKAARQYLAHHHDDVSEAARSAIEVMADKAAKRAPTAQDEAALMAQGDVARTDAVCARVLRVDLTGVVSLRAKRAANLGLEVKRRSIGLMNTIRWQRHKRKKHQRLKKIKRNESESKREEMRARRERIRIFHDTTNPNKK